MKARLLRPLVPVIAVIVGLSTLVVFLSGKDNLQGLLRLFQGEKSIEIESYSTFFTHAPYPDTTSTQGDVTALYFTPYIKVINLEEETLVINDMNTVIFPLDGDIQVKQFPYQYVLFALSISDLESYVLEGGDLEKRTFPIFVPATSQVLLVCKTRFCFQHPDGRSYILGGNPEQAWVSIPQMFGIHPEQKYLHPITWSITIQTNMGEISEVFTELIVFNGMIIRLRDSYGEAFDSLSV